MTGLGFGERKQVRKLLRRIARGDIPGEGAAGKSDYSQVLEGITDTFKARMKVTKRVMSG